LLNPGLGFFFTHQLKPGKMLQKKCLRVEERYSRPGSDLIDYINEEMPQRRCQGDTRPGVALRSDLAAEYRRLPQAARDERRARLRQKMDANRHRNHARALIAPADDAGGPAGLRKSKHGERSPFPKIAKLSFSYLFGICSCRKCTGDLGWPPRVPGRNFRL